MMDVNAKFGICGVWVFIGLVLSVPTAEAVTETQNPGTTDGPRPTRPFIADQTQEATIEPPQSTAQNLNILDNPQPADSKGSTNNPESTTFLPSTGGPDPTINTGSTNYTGPAGGTPSPTDGGVPANNTGSTNNTGPAGSNPSPTDGHVPANNTGSTNNTGPAGSTPIPTDGHVPANNTGSTNYTGPAGSTPSPTDDHVPANNTGSTNNTGPAVSTPSPTDGHVPANNTGSTNYTGPAGSTPIPIDGPGPTNNTEPTDYTIPADSSPSPTDGPRPTKNTEPTSYSGPTEGTLGPTDDPVPTSNTASTKYTGSTDDTPMPSDGRIATNNTESTAGSPDATHKPTAGNVTTGNTEPTTLTGSAESTHSPADGNVTTDNTEPTTFTGSTETTHSPADGNVTTDNTEPTTFTGLTETTHSPTNGNVTTGNTELTTFTRLTESTHTPADGNVTTGNTEPTTFTGLTETTHSPADGNVTTDNTEPTTFTGSTETKHSPADGNVTTDNTEPTTFTGLTETTYSPTDGNVTTGNTELTTFTRLTESTHTPADGNVTTGNTEPTTFTGSTESTHTPADGNVTTANTEPTTFTGSTESTHTPADGTVTTDNSDTNNVPKTTDETSRSTYGPALTDNPEARCGNVSNIEFGTIILHETNIKELDSSASVVCNKGYVTTKETVLCLDTGEWEKVECLIRDCGTLRPPLNGKVDVQDGTTYNAVATFYCGEGYLLVGDVERTCTARGRWDGLTPVCVKRVEKITTCPEDVDSKGMVWSEVRAGAIRVKDCPDGFSGNISRRCNEDGKWNIIRNNCVRQSVKDVQENVAALGTNATEDEIKEVLEEITKVTKREVNIIEDEKLTDGELGVLVTSLKEVVETVLATPEDVLNENITDGVFETTSNLIDDANQESWKRLKETDSRDAEKVLRMVESIGDAFCPTLESSGIKKQTIIKKNLAFEAQKVSINDVMFPNPDVIQDKNGSGDKDWLKETKSKIQLESASLKNNPCSVTAVIYRNLSDILPANTASPGTSSIVVEEQQREKINAPILAMSISPPMSGKIDPPVRITFEHADTSLTQPVCAFWQFQNDSQGYWSSNGCKVNFTNENYTICECDHLTNFAILMSPFSQADASSQALRIVSIVGIGVSVFSLLITFVVHIYLWRYLRHDRTTRLMNLCIALLLSYVIFLAGVDRTESTIACTVIAAVLQYIYLVVFSIMLVEGIEIAVSVLYVFKTKSRTKLLLILAWVLPGVIVGISLGVTKADGYGNSNFCWLSIDNGVIWAFVAPALVIIFSNIICLVLVIRAMFQSTAVKNKKASEKIKTSLRSLCVLVPIMGISWLLGIFHVNDSFYFIQYIFAILNGLQGFFIFLFHCLLNKQVKNAFISHAKRKSSTYFSTNNTSKDERNTKSKDKTKSEGAHHVSKERENKIFQESFAQNEIQVGPSLGMCSKGSLRKSAAFNAESRDRLIRDSSDS